MKKKTFFKKLELIYMNKKVALVTGNAFGSPNCIRISYAASMEQLKEAVYRIKSAISQLN